MNTTQTTPVALDDAYAATTFDPLRPADLLFDEVQQRRETGYDVDDVVRAANATDPEDRTAVLALVDGMTESVRRPGWPYQEPDALDDIRQSLPALPARTAVDPAAVADTIGAAWLGRIAGCNLGKPVEMGSHWTVEHIRDYLQSAGAYPLTDYFPLLDPMPERFELRENWPWTTRGNVRGSDRDDDIDYPILGLHLLETHGAGLRPEHVATAWTTLFPLRQVFTAERAAYINLVDGLLPPDVARFRNPYREWIGAQIRGDIFGWVHPGDPWAAAELSYQDASLSHVGNGIYGEMWSAALVAAAFTATSPLDAVQTSRAVVPSTSRLAQAIDHVVALHAGGLSWEEGLEAIRLAYGHYSWVHTINNAAVVVAGLLWGEGDYTSAVGKTVMSGWDTDSNGATVGSVMGVLCGTSGLPPHFIEPLQDRTRSALFGFDGSRISDLAARTTALATAFAA